MINQQLVDYIKQQVQAGISKDVVRKALADAGWSPTDVDDSLRAAEPAVAAVAGPAVQASQATINPVVAMGGVDVAGSSKSPTTGSSSDKFFSRQATTEPSVVKASVSDEGHPPDKKFMAAIIAMGMVILLLAGSLVFMYLNLNGQLEAARGGAGNPSQAAGLEQQVSQLNADKEVLAGQVQALSADSETLMAELSFFVPPASATSTAPMSAIIKGTLSGSASTTFVLVTPRNLRVVVANSANANVAAALAPLVGSTEPVTLAGTHPPGSLNLTVTAVNGAPL